MAADWQARADGKILYVSGYTLDLVTQQGIRESGSEILQKPFSINALLSRVRDVLDTRVHHAEARKAAASNCSRTTRQYIDSSICR